ncbi:hypothetical protein SASPL_117015 [Salvia splendens]|uniref:CCHC-type domain-containing protein n=1 Tax=Salvia splendens TaxID=180675 RepID=A0A8X8XXP5_SALSN|nr:hypothetical protein SASPL_121622 [Salvia splendens]KAG6420485.1 hypothetical protein SASPL_117015 [Salvia splendens]
MADDESQNSRETPPREEPHEEARIPDAAPNEQFIQTMTALFQQVAQNLQPPPPQVVQPTQPSIIKEVHKYRAEEFRGREEDDPTRAEYWLEQLERIMGFLIPTANEKLKAAVALLKDEAYRWWVSVLQVTPNERVNWEFFLKEFQKRYIGEQFMEDRRQEFLQLLQGERTVQQYETEFRRLAKYAKEMVTTDADMCRRFRQGLKMTIQKDLLGVETTDLATLSSKAQAAERMTTFIETERQNKALGKRPAESSKSTFQGPGKRTGNIRDSRSSAPARLGFGQGQWSRSRSQQTSPTVSVGSTGGSDRKPVCAQCGKRHYGECRQLSGACYGCGATDHYLRNCPMGRNSTAKPVERSGFTPSRGRRPDPSIGIGRGGERTMASEAASRAEPRALARTYAIRAREEHDAPDVILGTFLIFNIHVTALIDPGSTHSYMCSKLIEDNNLPLEETNYKVDVSSPLGKTIVVNRIYRECPIIIQGYKFPADLMELPCQEFDLILGMDWLSAHQAIVDCNKKRMTLRTLDDQEVLVVGERNDYLSNVISAATARRILNKG